MVKLKNNHFQFKPIGIQAKATANQVIVIFFFEWFFFVKIVLRAREMFAQSGEQRVNNENESDYKENLNEQLQSYSFEINLKSTNEL